MDNEGKEQQILGGGPEKLNLILIIVIELDPCYKLEYVEMYYEEMHGIPTRDLIVSKVRKALERILEEYTCGKCFS